MNISKFFLIFIPLVLFKYPANNELINYNVILKYDVKDLFKRVLQEQNEDIKDDNDENDEGDEEDEYYSYLKNRGTNEFDKVKYKYAEYVRFSIFKSKNIYTHIFNELLVFLGAQYGTEEEIVVHVKLIDILSLLFTHYKDNLSKFGHILNSFQDRSKLMNSVENEFMNEFINERDNYIYDVKNAYNKSDNNDDEWIETVLNKKNMLYDKFLKEWRIDGSNFYSIHNKKKTYLPKKVFQNKQNYIPDFENMEHVDLVCKPISDSAIDEKSAEKYEDKELNINEQNEQSNSKKEQTGNDNVSETKMHKEESSDSSNKTDESNVCKSENKYIKKTNNNKKIKEERHGFIYKMRNDFFLSDASLNVISLINSITSNEENKIVKKLYTGLKKLKITTFDNLIRYTNIIGIFFSYDIFDELYLQIKLIKEYFGLIPRNNDELSIVSKSKNVSKIKVYGKYNITDDEMFVPPVCLSAYCKLRSVWMQNRDFNFKIEKYSSNSINFMTLGDIGRGFKKENSYDEEQMLKLIGFNELKSTSNAMKDWHASNNADFVINLGDNVPEVDELDYLKNFEWHKIMRELFTFRKQDEDEEKNDADSYSITKDNIQEFYKEVEKQMNNTNTDDKNQHNDISTTPINNYTDGNEGNNNSENNNGFREYINDNTKDYNIYKNETTEKEETYDSIPFFSIFGEKDYFYFPSEQIQEHYAKRIPGYFFPNNYYRINYDFVYNNKEKNGVQEKFKASFIFIDTWSLMIGFPIIRNYRSFREQFNWINKALLESAKESDWIFVVGHHPFISSGRRSDNYSFEELSFHNIIRNFFFYYNIDGYFSAHDNLMEYLNFGPLNLFVNGSSSRVLFDKSTILGRGYFGKMVGSIYPVTCYLLTTIHSALRPKGCDISKYSKWSNKYDIGFSAHKLSKDELVTEFINSRSGKPVSQKIVIKNKKDKRRKFYDLDGYTNDKIKQFENKIYEFSSKNPNFIKYKIEEFKENDKKLNIIMNNLKSEEEKDAFRSLMFLNNLIFGISSHISNISFDQLKLMCYLANKYRTFFNKKLIKFLGEELKIAVQKMEVKTTNETPHNSNEILNTNENESIQPNDPTMKVEQIMELIDTLGYKPDEFLEKYDAMTQEEKDALKEKLGNDVSLEDYLSKVKMYIHKKKLSAEELKEYEENEENIKIAEVPDESKEDDNTNSQPEDTIDQENKDDINDIINAPNEVHKNYKELVEKEKKLTENEHALLMLSSLKTYDEMKYSLNILSKKEVIKEEAHPYGLYYIEKHKTFFQVSLELCPDIKRIISNLGKVGTKLAFYDYINNLYNKIMDLKNSIDKIAIF
ncbi:serine/threonine protein phosphatase, putative [Plasmodium berghei]|uniref:Serine/threonine-protein phosphatase UIS2 n=2 Tax=Plasmodium berghei TaxID=5821 RepID=UIS2_PLABA|nr:serine/threonine protein phosphatase UIS2 [Plasmodium berghei ANKA]A0A509AQ20.1 RecName: Full=Serine/threonine-protein phosphatase UIS2; AltName: Full=Up-regulated in infective sporozoite protein 2; Flags: Precursor [Plasmodium berghei ANKA]CXI95229.1 serine/threonine protein phosphatase, putative [Plasmodium berghei]SCL97117.1 serine/threonine protein phosphatase, putative [Plasmodium berghei]SCM16555.1 serine/threonine protein phosphatase, putative [Plasmodium berghei]SCM18352.1 serine/th|eukprot:XP_034423436.1 serine/threonine protein phosphatase UIS2 [Plasmodium berghei ANKA]